MKKLLSIAATFLCSALLVPGAACAQKPTDIKLQPAPATTVTVDGSEAMFTTMCALLASGFEADVSAANWSPMRAQLRDRMQHQQGPTVEVLRNFYKQHELANAGQMLSRYIWFGLISGPAPKFEPLLRRDELPPEVIALEGFQEILSNYYKEQKIGQLWRQVQPVYNHEIEQIHDSVAQVVFVATGYLREILDPSGPRSLMVHDHCRAVGGANHQRTQFRRSLFAGGERIRASSTGPGAPRLFAFFAGPFAIAVFARGGGEVAAVFGRGRRSAAGPRLEG